MGTIVYDCLYMDGLTHIVARDETGNPVGGITVTVDSICAWCGNLWCSDPHGGTMLGLVKTAAIEARNQEAKGCIIHSQKEHPFYSKLGFRPIHGVPGGYSASMDEILKGLGID